MEQRKKFYIALAIYAALGLAIWLTIDNTTPVFVGAFVPLGGKGTTEWLDELLQVRVTLRQLTLTILGAFAALTLLHWTLDQIKARRQQREELEEFKG